MKKLFVVLIAAMLVAGFAGKAAASYFNDGDLIRVVFDTASHVEVATDLGSLSGILAGGSLSADSFKAYFTTGGTTDWANMQVAYFSFNSASPSTVYASGSSTTPLQFGGRKWGGADGGWVTMQGVGVYNGSSSTVSTLTTADASFYSKLDGGHAWLGQYVTVGSVDFSLAALATQQNDGGVALYSMPTTQALGNHTATATGLTLYTLSDGTTSTTSPVPVPPAILLLAPGLIGLIGIRRRLS